MKYCHLANSIPSYLKFLSFQKIDHPAYGKKHGIANRDWWSDFIVRVFVAAGYKGDPAVLNKVSEALLVHYHEGRNAWEMINGSNKNLEDLKRLGLRLGVVSNSDDSTLPMLRTLGLMPFFDFVINTSNSGLEKPDPEIYRRALEAAGGVSPEDAAHVGDEVEADYTAPRKIGMLAFLLDRQQRLRNADLEGVDRQFVIHDLSKLCSLVELKQ